MLVAGAGLGACGDEKTNETAGQAPATTSTTTARPLTTSMELTTTDGYRYKITLDVGPASATGSPNDCPGTAAPGKAFLPVTVTVANAAADKAAPFPPVRVELAGAPGTKPGQVLVKDASGACTFSPRQPSIAPGAAAVFRGTTPAIDANAAPGTAGQVEVKVSETTFSLSTRVP